MRKHGLVSALSVLLLMPVSTAELQAQDGFLFGRPQVQLTVRAGPMMHRASSDLFDFFRSELTLDRSDFRAPAVSADLAFAIHRRVDLVLGGSWSSMESGSEFRHLIEEDDAGNELPIEQVTRFRVIPVTLSARFYPLERGRRISDLAWVPARTTPYIGGGGGLAFYRLEQEGDFVGDDLTIFSTMFRTAGQTAIGHAFAGVDHWFTPRVGMNIEGRYTVGSAAPDNDFRTWDSIDLSGAQLGVGLTLRW